MTKTILATSFLALLVLAAPHPALAHVSVFFGVPGFALPLAGNGPGRGYFAILRLYGSTETAIDKSWTPGDIEKAQ
jgi:hypothetical protein